MRLSVNYGPSLQRTVSSLLPDGTSMPRHSRVKVTSGSHSASPRYGCRHLLQVIVHETDGFLQAEEMRKAIAIYASVIKRVFAVA